MRKHYIDNIRWICVLLLFPYHILMIYNNWGEDFYIHGGALLIPSVFNSILSFWMMPLLFAVAGISSRYALEKRSAGEYIKERVNKLLLPFIFGVLLVVPIQPYIAGLYFNGGAGYFDSFTKVTDLSGYDGAFTPGHLWFILFLFVISMVCLPFILLYKDKGKGTLGSKMPLILVMLMGLLPCIGSLVKIGGQSTKSPTEYLAYFLLGYFFLCNDTLLEKSDRYRFLLLGSSVLYSCFTRFIIDGEFYEMASWLWILTVLGMGRRYLNFNGKITAYLSNASFGIYLFHQSWIIIAAYYIFQLTNNPPAQMALIFLVSVPATFATYEICRRIGVTRFLLGIKKHETVT